jgi:hypothetical protein
MRPAPSDRGRPGHSLLGMTAIDDASERFARLASEIAEWEERQAALLEWAKRTPGQPPT